jgi:TonB family protein
MEWFIKANLNLAVFYVVYLLVIRFSGRFQFARMYLLLVPLVSILLPLLPTQVSVEETMPAVLLDSFNVTTTAVQQQEWSLSLNTVLWSVYIAGVGISLLITAVSICRLLFTQTYTSTAYSFFHHIYIPEVNDEKGQMMQLHEEAHVKQWHTLDTIWYVLVRAVFWMNPVVYKLFNCLKEEHEYSADVYAISQNGNKEAYCELLLDETFGVSSISELAHSFHSRHSLFNRINMITQTQPQSVAWWKRIVTVPLLGTLVLISVMGTNTFAQKVEGKIYKGQDLPQLMPEFPGGQENMMKFLSTELKYPEKCRDQKIEGRVVIQFVVDKNGRVRNVKSMKEGVDPLLVKEALRVVSAMPKWNPGVQNGEAVNTEMTLPVSFKL